MRCGTEEFGSTCSSRGPGFCRGRSRFDCDALVWTRPTTPLDRSPNAGLKCLLQAMLSGDPISCTARGIQPGACFAQGPKEAAFRVYALAPVVAGRRDRHFGCSAAEEQGQIMNRGKSW